MNRRRALEAVLAGALSPLAIAQPRAQRLALFSATDPEQFLEGARGRFLAGLAALGHVQGRNLELHERYAHGDAQALARLADEIVALRPDVIVTEGTPATMAVQLATRTIPIVTSVGDPVGAGFARSMRSPGGNVTGVSQNRADLSRKQVEVLRQVFPGATEIALLVNRGYPGVMSFIPPAEEAAREASLAARVLIYKDDDFVAAFKECAARRLHAAIALADGGREFGAAAVRHGVGVVIPLEALVEHDALAAVDVDAAELLRTHIAIVDRVLRGANPGETPFSGATRYRLAVNARTAAALGLRLPPELVLRADRVIQ